MPEPAGLVITGVVRRRVEQGVKQIDTAVSVGVSEGGVSIRCRDFLQLALALGQLSL